MDEQRGLTAIEEFTRLPGAEVTPVADAPSTSAGAIEAESTKPVSELSYAESAKIQQAFFDQNCNACDEESPFLLLNSEEDDAQQNWGTWSPETEKYWTLQYSDVKRALAEVVDDGDTASEVQKCSNGDTLLLMVNDDGFEKEIPKKYPGAHENGPYKPPPPPPSNNRTLRQVTFLVCSRPAQAVSVEYDDPEVRMRFTAKVLMLKTVQLLLIAGAVLWMRSSSQLQHFHQAAVFTVWTSAVVYVILLLSAKANLLGVTRKSASIVILLETLCVTEICFAIICNSDPYVILCILINLSFTYFVLAICCRFCSLDVLHSNNLITLTWLLVLLGSVGILGLLEFYSNTVVAGRPLMSLIANYWIPILLASGTLVLLTLSELFQILQGNRIPLLNAEFDWIQATAQLI